jgi:spermidine/putrescine transport system ATP-binding protein
MDRAAAVELNGVSKRFGDDVIAVDNVDLIVNDGEFFSLLGPSGCGKTTTLRMIAGFEYPTSGSLKIHGVEMGLKPANQRPVNTVFQSYALFPHMTVFENVAFGLRMQKVEKSDIESRVARALDQVQLSHRSDAKPSQLSGGMQQRVALARALVNEPEVLLLDEPLGALDLKLRQNMQYELKDLQSRVGITFIYVTHDQEEALTMSDRIGVMNAGKLLQVGTPTEIYETPKSRFVADFIGDINFIEATASAPGMIKLANGVDVHLGAGQTADGKVTLAIRPERLTLHRSETEIAEGRNRLRARITRRVYFGDSFFYDVDVGIGQSLEVREENRPDIQTCDSGEEAWVSWRPHGANLVGD